MSYMHLARLINNVYPKVAARISANACSTNPIALAVPCHRVIQTDGQFAGCRWDTERKPNLIEMEATPPTKRERTPARSDDSLVKR